MSVTALYPRAELRPVVRGHLDAHGYTVLVDPKMPTGSRIAGKVIYVGHTLTPLQASFAALHEATDKLVSEREV